MPDMELFKFIDTKDILTNNNFSCIGGDGTGSYAFWKYAEAYYDAAEILYQNIEGAENNHWVKDSLIYPMCFMYRHFMELILKSLYIKYAKPSQASLSQYLKDTSHYLDGSWSILRPILKPLRDRAGSSISLGDIGDFVQQMQNFDSGSMSMRYPVDNSSQSLLQYGRLDYENLHSVMNVFYNSIMQLDYDLDNQMVGTFPDSDISAFKDFYLANKEVVKKLYEIASNEAQKESSEVKSYDFSSPEFLKVAIRPRPELDYFQTCTYEQKMLIEELYYSGRDVLENILKLPRSPYEAAIDIVKMSLYHMRCDGLKLGEVNPTAYFNIVSKGASGISRCLGKSIEALEWIDKTPMGRQNQN